MDDSMKHEPLSYLWKYEPIRTDRPNILEDAATTPHFIHCGFWLIPPPNPLPMSNKWWVPACVFWTTPALPELATFWDVVSATQPRPASGLDSFVLLADFHTRRNDNHGKSYPRTGQTYSGNDSQSEGTISLNLFSSESNRSRTHPMCCEWIS